MLKTEVNELWALNQEMWLLHMYRDHLDQTNDKLEQDETRLEFELKEIWEWDTGNERTVRDRIADLQFAIEQEDERLEVLYRDHDRMEQRNLEMEDEFGQMRKQAIETEQSLWITQDEIIESKHTVKDRLTKHQRKQIDAIQNRWTQSAFVGHQSPSWDGPGEYSNSCIHVEQTQDDL